jgi:cytochrome c biogenesis protein CcmG/thiol:disulfide interchange protein DsbE
LLLLILSVRAFAQTVTAPPLELTDLKGRHFRLANFKGKVVLVNFWATWCPPCRTEIPELVKWQRRYRNRGLQVIGITYPPQTRSEVRRFTRKVEVNYPVALGTKETKRVFTSSETLPTTAVIDSEGNVRDVIEGIVFPEEFEQKIKPLLAGQTHHLTISTRSARRTSTNLRRATIYVNAEGYRPTNVVLRRGIPTRLTFIRTDAEGCGTEIVIPALGINRPLPLNVPVVVSFTPNKSGRFKLTCGMDMFRGSLIVR